MKKIAVLLAAAAMGLGVLGSNVSRCAAVPINNAGFDTLYKPGSTSITANIGTGYTINIGSGVQVIGGATYSDSTTGPNVDVPGWTGGNRTGVQGFAPGGGQFAAGADSSPNSVYVQGPAFGGGDNILVTSDPLGALAASKTYTLTIRVGWRSDVNSPVTQLALDLNANGLPLTPTASVTPALVQGAFVTYSNTYSAASVASFVGQTLSISFGTGTGTTGGEQQTEFDTVSLSATPEPASIGLLCVGGLSILARRRRA